MKLNELGFVLRLYACWVWANTFISCRNIPCKLRSVIKYNWNIDSDCFCAGCYYSWSYRSF